MEAAQLFFISLLLLLLFPEIYGPSPASETKLAVNGSGYFEARALNVFVFGIYYGPTANERQ